ncbi:MAG: hypothetical protein E6H63_05765 [Betaproteobacteria bacterium]|nr:MAG: hypothetical protein E6H63_05765 [Betaproteobacteria bacterium]
MKRLALAALAALFSIAHADDPADAIQRELIQRDRQSAEFAHPALRAPDTALDQAHLPTRPDERQAQARERDAEVFSERQAPAPAPDSRPLPLPGGARHGVDPIPVQGGGG